MPPMTMTRRAWRLLVAAGALATLAGCATPIAKSVVTANLAQEEAVNQLLVLNIARAHQRMPMHFSLIGQIRAAPGGWGLGVPSLGLELPFGGAAERKYNLTAGSEGQTPVDVTALSSQEFLRGMTQPVPPDMLAVFVNQGWSVSLLMHLFLESVQWVDQDGKPVQRLVNDPGSSGWRDFRLFVEAVSACDVVADAVPDRQWLSSTVPSVSVEHGVQAAAAKLELVPVTAQGAVPRTADEPAQHLRLARVDREVVLRLKPPVGDTGTQAVCRVQLGSTEVANLSAKTGPRAARGTASSGGVTAQVVLRSPQSMLYYLGQLSRAQNGNWKGWADANGGDRLLQVRMSDSQRAVMFDMSNRRDVAHPAVEVPYQGDVYAVAKALAGKDGKVPDRSMSTLSLMVLILGLQDKGTEPPATSSVRVLR